MLEPSKELLEAFDSEVVKPLNNIVIARRDSRPDELTLKETGLKLALPEDQMVRPDWVTVLAAPKVINDRFGERSCTLKAGDRCFARPSAGYKMWEMDQDLQTIHVTDILAVEVDGKPVPFDHNIFIQKAKRAETFKGGLIIIPETSNPEALESQDRGTITQLGANVQENLAVDDLVLVDKTQTITLDKETRTFCLPEDLVFMVLETVNE